MTLIQNNTGNPTTPGTPADGSIVTLGGGVTAKLFYNGGDGNDVVLATTAAQTTVYVDDSFTGSGGKLIADADLGTTGNQQAVLGVNAFTTITAALAAVSSSGTLVINGGTYGEAVTLSGTQAIRITGPNAAQTVVIDALTTAAGQNIQIDGTSNLTVGDATSTTIAGLITGRAA